MGGGSKAGGWSGCWHPFGLIIDRQRTCTSGSDLEHQVWTVDLAS